MVLSSASRTFMMRTVRRLGAAPRRPVATFLGRHGARARAGGLLAVSFSTAAAVHFTAAPAAAEAEAREAGEKKAFNIVRRVGGSQQPQDSHSRVRPSSLDELAQAAAGYDVVIVGEVHDDAEAHRLELELLKQVHEKHRGTRQIVLSLEMVSRALALFAHVSLLTRAPRLQTSSLGALTIRNHSSSRPTCRPCSTST
jgi:hypothetical protein